MSSHNKRTIRHFQSQNEILNPLNNNKNTNTNIHSIYYSKYNNHINNNNNQSQTQTQTRNITNNNSSNKVFPSYQKRTSTSNYQYKYNRNIDSNNHNNQNINSNNQRNSSSLTNTITTINLYNQNKNNNIITNRFDNNNNDLSKSNDNYIINRRTNHRVFERVPGNKNANTNSNTNIIKSSNNTKINANTFISTNNTKINSNTVKNINRGQNINENKNNRYNALNSNSNRMSYKTAKLPDYKQKTTVINRIQSPNNIEQNDISKYHSFKSPINNKINNNNLVTSQLMEKNEKINKEKSLKGIRAYYKTRYGSKITTFKSDENDNDDNTFKNSINDNQFVNKSINFDSKLKTSINNNESINNSINKSINKSINNNNDIQYKNSFRKSEIVIDSNNNEITLKNANNKTIEKELSEEQILFSVTKKEIGIMNLGNSCFINACLQILIHCPLFIYKLIKNLNLINENTPITSNFISICIMMANTNKKRIDISDFKNILGIKHVIYDSYMQNDSQEFCRILLEDISRELNEIKEELTIYRMLSNSDRKSKEERDIEFHENFIQREKSIVTDLFYAQVLNIFKCECKAEIYSFQKILDFPLLFPDNKNNDVLSINDLLQLYFKTEYIDFETICQKCQKKAKHKKEIRISRAPDILILSLQRIDVINNRKKLDYLVNFPQKLNMYEFMDHDCGHDKDCEYELFGIINHMGSINSGHYYSYIKIENKDWFEFNDSKVMKIDNLSDTSESAYALFYIRKQYIDSTKFII